MAWVAVDRVIQSAEQFGLDGPLEAWRTLRKRIHEDVCRHGYDNNLGTFVQSYGSKKLDAGLLLIPLVDFLSPQDARMHGTVTAIERHLMLDGLVRRYEADEGRAGISRDGLFLSCSFWLTDNYVLQGRLDDARRLLERHRR